MEYSTTTSVLVTYCYIFHPWTRQRFSWVSVIGGWHVSEEVASNYGYRNEEEMAMQQRLRQHVALELFYVFGPRGSKTSLERQKKKHVYTKGGDAYAAGKLASMIWQEEPDNEMLQTSEQVVAFRYKLGQLTDPNPRTKATFSDALGMLTSDPIKNRLPTECFRTGI